MRDCARSAAEILAQLRTARYTPLDLFADNSAEERLVSLLLGGAMKSVSPDLLGLFGRFREQMEGIDTSGVKVVVFGGGTGLATIVGGDSRREDWPERPFTGLKQYFSDLHSVVCVTDDGGSTGELRKTLPLVALGDLRHVLLAAVRRDALIRIYALSEAGAGQLALNLHRLFNYRFSVPPKSAGALLSASGLRPDALPGPLRELLLPLLESLFLDPRLSPVLAYPQCLGNLLLAAAIYRHLRLKDSAGGSCALARQPKDLQQATIQGLADLARALGVQEDAVLPAALTPAELSLLYSNGVLSTSEDKSSAVRRFYPVDRVMTAFCGEAALHPGLLGLIAEADILLFAPGSLYTSIIPILQIPGVAGAIRANHRALKLLVANIWVQMGETDATREAPERKFYVSDMVTAYHRNIPGGVQGLFSHVIALDMADIPGSVLQGYALEAKEPIMVDRGRVQELGFGLIEAAVFSRPLLSRQKRIQHDPDALARTVKALWLLRHVGLLKQPAATRPLQDLPPAGAPHRTVPRLVPCERYARMRQRLAALGIGRVDTMVQAETESPAPLTSGKRQALLQALLAILWRHPDIPLEHLAEPQKIWLVDTTVWKYAQEWDNIVSTYQPETRRILIRDDQIRDGRMLESAFLQALGQSLLGNYAAQKSMEPLLFRGSPVGLVYRLQMAEPERLKSFLKWSDIGSYLQLIRMRPSATEQGVFTRAVNLAEGFTPPGLYFGLFYAWYLDNALAPTIEYKMAIMRNARTSMIAEQARMSRRRGDTIDFFREKVFRQGALLSAAR